MVSKKYQLAYVILQMKNEQTWRKWKELMAVHDGDKVTHPKRTNKELETVL